MHALALLSLLTCLSQQSIVQDFGGDKGCINYSSGVVFVLEKLSLNNRTIAKERPYSFCKPAPK